MKKELPNEHYQNVREHGAALGAYFATNYPPTKLEGAPAIPDPVVPLLCDAMLVVVAEVIQAYIDAGSERESTMENEDLWAALEGEFGGYGDDYTKYQTEQP